MGLKRLIEFVGISFTVGGVGFCVFCLLQNDLKRLCIVMAGMYFIGMFLRIIYGYIDISERGRDPDFTK